MRKLAIAIIGATLATPVAAQDIAPAMDLPTMAQGQIISSTAKAQARRGRDDDGLSPRAAATCANKAKARSRYGADDPRVAQLYRLCAQAGR